MVCYNDKRLKRDMADICKPFQALPSVVRLRFYLVFAAFGSLACLLAFAGPVLASEPEDITDSKLAFGDDQLLVLGLNARADEDEPEHEFEVSLTNSEAFSEAPTVTVEWFVFNEDQESRANSWSLAADGENAPDYSAVEWFAEAQRSRALEDTADGATNELDFAINLPQDAVDGSYVAAIVVRDQQAELLAAKPIIINVGIDDGGQVVDLDLPASELKLDEAQAEATIANQADWHIDGSLSLRLSDGEDEDNDLTLALQPLAADFIGVFANSQQVFQLEASDDEQKSLEDFLKEASEPSAALVFLSDGDEELASWEVADLGIEESSGEAGSEEEGSAAGNSEEGGDQAAATLNEGSSSASTGSLNLLSLIAGGIGIVILIILLLVMRRRRQRAVSFGGGKVASSSPAEGAKPPQGTSPPADEAKQPAPPAQAAATPDSPLGETIRPADEKPLQSAPPSPLDEAKQPAPPAQAAATPDSPIPAETTQQPPQATESAGSSSAESTAPPALAGMPELPSIEGLEPPAPLTNQLPPSDVDGPDANQPPPPSQQPPPA